MLDTTLIPAVVRVRASEAGKGLFAGQAAFGRNVSKTEWVYGFKVALFVSPEGFVTAFGLAEANSDERTIGEFLISSDGHDAYLADKGFSSVRWERYWLELRSARRGDPAREPPPSLAGGGSAMVRRKAAAHRGRHRPAQRSLCSGTPPRQDPRWPAHPAGGEGGRLHCWTSVECRTRTDLTPSGGSLRLNNCAASIQE